MHHVWDRRIAEAVPATERMATVDEVIELLGLAYFQGYHGLIVHNDQLPTNFFNLKNGMAGEVLQKFANLRMPLAIIGDHAAHSSQALGDFIRESNKGRQVNFRGTVEEALRNTFGAP